MECKDELKQQMSALQGDLEDSKRPYRWVSKIHCGLGRGVDGMQGGTETTDVCLARGA